MSADTPEQLEGLKRAGRLVAATLRALRGAVAPGVTTRQLDEVARDMFAKHGARSGPILLTAHEEHTIMVARNGPVVLTAGR